MTGFCWSFLGFLAYGLFCGWDCSILSCFVLLVMYCWSSNWYLLLFLFSCFIVNGFFDSLDKVFNCLILFVFIVAILNISLSFFWFFNYLFWSKFMLNMCGVLGLVIMGCF